uniref:Endoplasmic reticulum transmembrane protein n=1 Tax=Meleagris gallopavo TaxID=9103 RepID=A0A803YI41_MELGA
MGSQGGGIREGGGTALLTSPFCSLLRRLVTLISQQALLGASSQAFRKQAEGASQAARRYMEDNEALRKQLQEAGDDSTPPSRAENENLKAKVEKLKEELAASKRTLEKAENEVQAMRRQAEGLTREYDRLLEQHARLQVLGGTGSTGRGTRVAAGWIGGAGCGIGVAGCDRKGSERTERQQNKRHPSYWGRDWER